MRRMAGLLSLILCLTLLCGCGNAGEASQPESSSPTSSPADTAQGPQTFSLAYSKDDTLDPYAAGTEVNLWLAGLLFDGLTVIDGQFTAVPSLASSVQQADSTHWVAQLRADARFADGSSITPADVTASFQRAKASANYRVLLSNVAAAAANGKTREITFTLSSPDPNAAACFSFPVIKSGTATNTAGQAPVGSGLYTVQEHDGGLTLTANPLSGKSPRYTTIPLRHLPNTDTMYYGLASGNITYYYDDLQSGSIPRVSGASATVNMNALFYLGIQNGKAGLSNPRVRQALSKLIDRKTLAAAACSGWALAATMPFHPAWSAVKELEAPSGTRDLSAAVELLEAAGYGTATGLQPLTLELIYSTESGSRAAAAEQIRSELEGAGIRVTVTPLGYNDYKNRLSAGNYDLYIGEVRLAANMSLDPLFTGAASFGVARDGAAATAYTRYRAGEITLAEFVQSFYEDLPYIPLCWRSGFAAFDRRLSVVTPHGYNPFYGMENWK